MISDSRALWFVVDMEEWSFVVARYETTVTKHRRKISVLQGLDFFVYRNKIK